MPVADRVKNKDTILTQMDGLLKSGKDVIKDGEFKFANFGKKELSNFTKSMDNLKISKTKQDELISTLINAKNSFNRLQSDLLQGNNLTIKNQQELQTFLVKD